MDTETVIIGPYYIPTDYQISMGDVNGLNRKEYKVFVRMHGVEAYMEQHKESNYLKGISTPITFESKFKKNPTQRNQRFHIPAQKHNEIMRNTPYLIIIKFIDHEQFLEIQKQAKQTQDKYREITEI